MHFLGDEGTTVFTSFGGKASNLHLLKLAGFDVPHGFVLTELVENLEHSVNKIGGYPVAVRSSCSLEDMKDASFAGLYETFLFVKDINELKETIQKCFDSIHSERVKDYLKSKNIVFTPGLLSMSVLVQKMVDPLVAGVLFTYNPTNGKEEEFYLEYCQGVGERLVSGHVTPTTCTYDIHSSQIKAHVKNQEGTLIPENLINELILQSRKIQAHFGTPQDIEWAIDKENRLFILQSRPITTFVFREDVPELTNADLKDGGVSARVCTPIMFSAYRNALQFSMADYFKKINLIKNADSVKWIFHLYGRVYWNAGAVKEGLKRIPDFNEEGFDRDLGIQKDYGTAGPFKSKLSLTTLINAIPVLIGLNKEFSACEVMVTKFRNEFESTDKLLKEKLDYLKDLSQSDFIKWFSEVLQFQVKTERNYFRTIYNNSNYQTEFKSLLKKQKNYSEGDEIELMAHLTGVSHLDIQADLEKLYHQFKKTGLESNEYKAEREKFLYSHYHHGPAELDLTIARWGEKKEWVDDLVRALVPSQRKENESFQKTVGRYSGNKFHKALARSRNFLVIREEMRAYSTRAYYLLRLGLLEFAKRWKLSEEMVFMLDLNEVIEALSTPEKPIKDLGNRMLLYRGYRNFEAPNEFGGSIIQQTTSSKDGVLKGLGCSPGTITGRARVITDIHKTLQLTKEDILVTLFTDPGWTPVLARVGGVVTEVGGLLSHAAVIGREYGIPAVLNLTSATKLIKDGSLIRVNGKTGEVEILEKSP